MRSTFEELSGSILPYTKAHVLSFVRVAKRKREVRLTTCANFFSFYTWLSNLDILCTRRPCKLSVTDARREGGRRKRKPVSKKVVTREYFCDEGHWLSDTQLEASFALWSDKRFFFFLKKKNKPHLSREFLQTLKASYYILPTCTLFQVHLSFVYCFKV